MDMKTTVSEEATVENAFSEVQRLIGWIQYVPEHEFSEKERIQLIEVSAKFAKIAQPIASKYID